MASTFIINGRRMNISGGNVSIDNGNLIINGTSVDLSSFGDEKVFNIVIQGNVETIDGEATSVTVEGDVGSVKGMSGTVKVAGDVKGNISTMSGKVSR